MNTIKSTPIIITLQLIIIASCHVLPVQENPCWISDKLYLCSDKTQALNCNAVKFCDEWKQSIFEREPAYSCDKKAKFCEPDACCSWPDDSVEVVKIALNNGPLYELGKLSFNKFPIVE